MSRSVLIIFNPVSGAGKRARVDAVKQYLEAGGAEVELYLTRGAGDATTYLQGYVGELDVVVAAGGDGTVNEVVNGLVDRPSDSYRLALIPTGTTNVLALELRLPKSPRQLADIILGENTRAVYPGRANNRRFLLMVGIGYDAWVVDKVNLALKKRVGKLAYVWSMLKQLRHFGKKQYRLLVDGQTHLANSVVITNGRYYGGSFVLSRQADLSHKTTQVLMISGGNPLTFLVALSGLPLGIMERMPGVVSVAARRIEVEIPGYLQREAVQADGDSLAELPLLLEMEDQALNVLVSNA